MPLSEQEKAELLTLARRGVEAAVRGERLPEPEDPSGVLTEERGCFVTLRTSGRLRGCIGTFRPDRPLGEMIVQMAAAAATQDPRFTHDRITSDELPEVSVHVSVLSPLTPTDEPEKLVLGKHGIYITRGFQGGCFLPEVATETGWSVEEFLDQCCTGKAGLPPGAWRDPETEVYLFTSEKTGE